MASTNSCDTSLRGEFHRIADKIGWFPRFDVLRPENLVLLTLMTFFLPSIPSLFTFQVKMLLNLHASPQACFINQENAFLTAKPFLQLSNLWITVTCSYFYKSLVLMGAWECFLSEPSLCRNLSPHIIYKVSSSSACQTSPMLLSPAPSPTSSWRGSAACNKCLSRLTVF